MIDKSALIENLIKFLQNDESINFDSLLNL